MPRLVVQDPGGVAIALAVAHGLRLGRDAECEVVLADGKVSRHHATLERDGDGWSLRDVGSRHGTWVNGVRTERARLADGDRIQLGPTIISFSAADEVDTQVVARTMDAARSERSKLAVFYGLAEAARSLADRDVVLARALRSVVEAVRAERGLFALAPAIGAAPRRVAEHDGAGIVVGRALVEAAMRGESLLVRERDAGTLDAHRELRNVPERAAALAAGPRIEVEDLRLSPRPRTASTPPFPATTPGTLSEQFGALDVTERRLVEEALARADGNVAEAARLLGITRIMMKRRLDRIRSGD